MKLLTTKEARDSDRQTPQQEVFVRVESHPKFAVSNFGVVVNTWNNKIKKTHVKKKTGDVVVSLDGMIYRVSHLVATAFLENPQNSRFVLHKDGNKLNNHSKNLYWNKSVRRRRQS